MIIRKALPKDSYTKMDNKVFTDQRLSDGAKVLYGYLASLRTGANFTDDYIVKAMGISKRALANRKKELKQAGLILIDQVSMRIYVIYIGHTRFSAEKVKQTWIEEDGIVW